MLPISEFHFAFCGIATVAATLGYACARRTALSSKADVEAGPHEERSLKRKLDDSNEHDLDTQEQSRPMKRNRTPPTDKHDPDDDEWQVVVAPPTYEQATAPEQDTSQENTPVREPTPPAYSHPETASQPEENGVDAAPQVGLSQNESETPTLSAMPAKIKPTNAFSAFSGSSSPFASYSNTSGVSPFALSGQAVRATPAWRHDGECDSSVFGPTSPANALAPSPNDALSPVSLAPSKNRISGTTQSLVKPCNHPTGEENETVEAELKGAKLFIKRGRKEFVDGMYGHIKILTQKSTPETTEAETTSRTRLLFRRDPLGQVSMNAGLNPTVRCHFDTAENILRVILMEQVSTDGQDPKEDVVIYALKPGRAGKADFLSFAKSLCDHEGLKSRVVPGSVAPGNATAS